MPVPGQEFGNSPGRVVRDADEHVGEVVLRIETVELGAFDQRVDRGGEPFRPVSLQSLERQRELLGAKVTCPKCRKSAPLERAIKR